MLKLTRLVVLISAVAATSVLAADVSERKFIREGMSEGEVLMKIGKPDSESADSGGGATTTVKRWIYFPASGDQQTMTTLVLRNGKVAEVTRQMSR